MKVRTLNELIDKVQEEMSWRRVELRTIRANVAAIPGAKDGEPDARATLRSSVALLYAHWEGGVREISRIYISFLSSQKVPYSNLSAPFLGTSLRQKLVEMEETSLPARHTEFVRFILESLSERSRFRDTDLPIDSNLNFDRFSQILDRFGINDGYYALQKNHIDKNLLKTRNEIAHGEWSLVTRVSYLDYHDHTEEILRRFENDVLNSAAQECYKNPLVTEGPAGRV